MPSRIKRMLLTLGLILAFAILLAGCNVLPAEIANQTPQPDPALDPGLCQTIVDQMIELTRSPDIPKHLQASDGTRQPGDFDPNSYFDILKHISMEPGYTLDYVYFNTFIGAEPILYARKIDEAPFQSTNEFYEATGEERDENRYLDHVRTDGTPQGFLEYIILAIHGEQFYLYWHAKYNDLQVVCTPERMAEIANELGKDDFGIPMTDRQKQRSTLLNVFPKSAVHDDAVEIRVATFTKWGGLEERTYTIRKAFPHKILNVEIRTMLHYDCGVNF